MAAVTSRHRRPRGPQNDLHKAAMKDSVGRTEALLSKGSIDIDQGDPHGFTPLMCAAVNGYSGVVRALLNKGADVTIVSSEGATALHASAQDGHVTVTKMLVEAGAYLEARSPQGATPLHMAAANGHSRVMRVLIEAGADPNCSRWDGATPIYSAGFKGYIDAVRVLLRAKADPACPKVELTGKTFVTLDMAAQNGHPEVVLELIQQVGIKACGGASGGVRALCQAGQQNHMGIMTMLADAGVVDSGEALAVAAGWGREEAVKFLLQQHRRRQQRTKPKTAEGVGAYVNRSLGMIDRTTLRSTIHVGGRSCSARIVRLLLDAGADTALFGVSPDLTPGGALEDAPLALKTRKLRRKTAGGEDATEDQLRRLEGIRRLFLHVEAVRAVSWLWPEGGSGIAQRSQGTRDHAAPERSETQPRMCLPMMRRRAQRRGALVEALSRYSEKS
ncbi:unnamed protein product [Scytosiphon promiscuus]